METIDELKKVLNSTDAETLDTEFERAGIFSDSAPDAIKNRSTLSLLVEYFGGDLSKVTFDEKTLLSIVEKNRVY